MSNELMVSLKFWQVKSPLVQFVEQVRAVTKVLQVVRGPMSEVTDNPDVDGFQTVVEAVTQLTEETAEGVSLAFERCVKRINEIVIAYGLALNHAIAPVTPQRLPQFVTYMTRNAYSEEFSRAAIFDLGHYNDVRRLVPPELDNETQATMISMIAATVIGDPVLPYLELSAEARRSLHREGDTRASAIYSQAACEVLLDSVLQAMLWEESMLPSDAVKKFFAQNSSLGARVRNSNTYAPRLGTGHWRLDGSGPVANWYSNVAALRNRCVHAGYRPSHGEAKAGLEAQLALRDFVADRLLDRQRRFPLAASLFTSRAPRSSSRRQDIANFGDWQTRFLSERGTTA
jgi:hypothetical protein